VSTSSEEFKTCLECGFRFWNGERNQGGHALCCGCIVCGFTRLVYYPVSRVEEILDKLPHGEMQIAFKTIDKMTDEEILRYVLGRSP